ncbi:hypothetical protein Nit79A3_1732 [Nitrosomonas sp. Is79A3]
MLDIAVVTISDAKSKDSSNAWSVAESSRQDRNVSVVRCALCLVQESNGFQYLIEEGARLVEVLRVIPEVKCVNSL